MIARRLGLGLLLLCQLWLLATPPAIAQTPAGSPPTELPPEQVRSLLQLLSDPVVKSWIEREGNDYLRRRFPKLDWIKTAVVEK